MLQIFVRPHTADLAPDIQFGRLATPVPNAWRPIFGPPDGDAPFTVRNAIECHDIRLAAGVTADIPRKAGCRTYFFVFAGRVTADEQTFGEAESGLGVDDEPINILATEDSLVVAFVIDPNAHIVRGGSVGDGETVHRMAARARGARRD
jgi:redox-sensitive bicupin YhaK (pirin superfamily)